MKYKTKKIVDAIKLYETTIDEILKLLPNNFPSYRETHFDIQKRVIEICEHTITGGSCTIYVNYGEWVVKTSKDRILIMSDEEFHEKYEEC